MKAEVQRRKAENPTQEINENVAIADIVFSYNNAKLILALRERGQQIALQKFDRVQA